MEEGSKSPVVNQEIGAALMIRHIFDERFFPKLLNILQERPMINANIRAFPITKRIIKKYENLRGRKLPRAGKPKVIILKDKKVKKTGYLAGKQWRTVNFPQPEDNSNDREIKKKQIVDCACSELNRRNIDQ